MQQQYQQQNYSVQANGTNTESRELYRLQNPMSDPDIIRGNTWSNNSSGAGAHRQGGNNATINLRNNASNQNMTVDGREYDMANSNINDLLSQIQAKPLQPSISVQTTPFLEAIPDTVEEYDACTQTDPMMELEELDIAPFVHTANGIDASTQVEPGELFNFDEEVKPLLDVIVGNVLRQSLREVCEEKELALLRRARAEARRRRAMEIAECRRLEEYERRREAEVAKRRADELRKRESEEKIARKLAASKFGSKFAGDLEEDVLDTIEARGGFQSPLECVVSGYFVPWIIQEAISRARARHRIHIVLGDMINKAAEKGRRIELGANDK